MKDPKKTSKKPSGIIETSENIEDEFATLKEDETALDAARKLAAAPRILLGCVFDDENKLIGVLDEDDILNHTILEGNDPSLVKVKDFMTTDIISVDANDSIEKAINLMIENEFEAVPILQGDNFLGVFTIFDAANHDKRILGLINDNLKETSQKKLKE